MTCSSRYETAAVGKRDEPGEQRRHLHARETFLGVGGVADDDREVERHVAHVRERVGGVDGERREHRVDALAERGAQELLVVRVEVVVFHDLEADLHERGREDLLEEL